MTQRPPATIGARVEDIDTPALIVDLDALDRNIARMAEIAQAAGVGVRPHAKTHKSPFIGHKQVLAGAIGLCCQKTDEAEALVGGGISDVLVTNQVVGRTKLARLAALARHAKIGVCVDDAANVAALSEACAAAGSDLDVLVEIDIGNGRCGVAPGAPAAALAQVVSRAPHLRFGGLQAYYGRAAHIRNAGERRAAIGEAAAKVRVSLDALSSARLPCLVVGGASTGAHRQEIEAGVWTELQPGSYVFMDADYRRNLDDDGAPARVFDHSLFVLTSVMSVAAQGLAVCDAGHKAAAVDSGPPVVHGRDDVEYAKPSDEHGRLVYKPGARRYALGDKVRLIPGHCDPTVNLYDWYVGLRGDRVEAVWPVAARGAMG